MSASFLTPSQAAARARCGRSSIMRALSSGQLRGTRYNEGRWRITPEALDDWCGLRRPPDRTLPGVTGGQVLDTPPDTLSAALALHAAEIRAEVAEAKLSYVEAERDRLAALLSEALKRPRRLWPWS